MTDTRDPPLLPDEINVIPLHGRSRSPANPIGFTPILNHERFVFDVRRCAPDFGVVFKDRVIARRPSEAAALENARLIASNHWSFGRRTLVRRIDDDGTITVIVAFG